MELNIGKETAALNRMNVKDLRARYADVFGEPTQTGNRPWLIKRIAWRLQATSEGDLSERARQRAAELANDADLRMSPPKINENQAAGGRTETVTLRKHNRLPPPGSTILREYKGEEHQVKVLEQGFEYAGDVYKSLSAVAKKITGTHCNGFHFFRLNNDGGQQ